MGLYVQTQNFTVLFQINAVFRQSKVSNWPLGKKKYEVQLKIMIFDNKSTRF